MEKGFNSILAALISIIQFLWDSTIGLIAKAASMNPSGMGIIHLILWVITLIFMLGLAVWFLVGIVRWLVSFFVGYGPFYRNPFVISPIVAWLCALLLVYGKFKDISLP
jgi:hypothetical protein